MPTWCDSECGRLRRVAIVAPSFYRQTDPINRRQEREALRHPVSRERLEAEHVELRRRLIDAGVDVVDLKPHESMPYLLNIRDVAVVVDAMLVECEMGEQVRRDEPPWVLSQLGATPRLGDARVQHGALEGGDVFLIGGALLVGVSQRTTRAGAEAMLGQTGRQIHLLELQQGILHMDTVLNVIGDVAVVAAGAFKDTRALFETLTGLGVSDVIEVTVEDADEFATNFLCIDERHVLVAESCEGMLLLLGARGIETTTVPMSEHHRIGGSVRCATLPLERDPVEGAT